MPGGPCTVRALWPVLVSRLKAATDLPTLKTAPDLTAAARLVVELSK